MTTQPRPIQIWQPAGDHWSRPPQGPFGDHYAAQQTLHKRAGPRRRLILVGESVAAGYLFAPHYTPAMALDARLDNWEVIDLARTNESLDSLAGTIDASLQLEPDVVVMWAGNNWMLRDLGRLSPYHPESTTRHRLGQVFRNDGPGGVTTFASQRVRAHVLTRLDAIAHQLESAGVRLVVVVPEVNLVDWEHAQPVTVLPGGTESRWHDEMTIGNHEQMLRLDQGSCATTHRLLGNTLIGQASLASYRREVAAAAGPLRGCVSSPMATLQIQDLLREWATDRALSTVDIPATIAADGLADRTWFLDYCHHTAPAIDTIMSLIATEVDPGHRGQPIGVEPELIAVARLGALMHTDHRLVASTDRLPLLRHQQRAAMQAWPDTPDLIRDLIESRLGATPVPLTSAQRRNLQRPYPFGFAHGWRPHTTEADALTALGLTNDDISLLTTPVERAWPIEQIWRPGQLSWIDEQPRSRTGGYFRSVRTQALFSVLTRPEKPTELELTARLKTKGVASLRLGGWAATVALDTTWTTHRMTIQPDAALAGLHPLVISWPRLSEDASRWHTVLADLDADRVPELHPVFGEVHSLKAL